MNSLFLTHENNMLSQYISEKREEKNAQPMDDQNAMNANATLLRQFDQAALPGPSSPVCSSVICQ